MNLVYTLPLFPSLERKLNSLGGKKCEPRESLVIYAYSVTVTVAVTVSDDKMASRTL